MSRAVPLRIPRFLVRWTFAVTCCGCATLFSAQEPAKATGVSTALQKSMASLKVDATFNLGADPDWMVVTADAVWVTTESVNQVTQLIAAGNTIGLKIHVEKPCSGLAAGFGSLWIPSCGQHALIRADLKTGRIQATIAAGPADSEGGITIGAGSVWLATSAAGTLSRIDPKTNTVVASIAIPAGSYAPVFAGGFVWVTSTDHNLLSKVDPSVNKRVAETPIGKSPRFLTAGSGSVWTLNQGDGTVSRVDQKTGKVVVIEAGLSGNGGEIAFGLGSVWATLDDFPVTRIDPHRNSVLHQWTGAGGDSIRAGLGSIWLTDRKAGKVWRISPGKL
jgi:virginiamycin B lyase